MILCFTLSYIKLIHSSKLIQDASVGSFIALSVKILNYETLLGLKFINENQLSEFKFMKLTRIDHVVEVVCGPINKLSLKCYQSTNGSFRNQSNRFV